MTVGQANAPDPHLSGLLDGLGSELEKSLAHRFDHIDACLARLEMSVLRAPPPAFGGPANGHGAVTALVVSPPQEALPMPPLGTRPLAPNRPPAPPAPQDPDSDGGAGEFPDFTANGHSKKLCPTDSRRSDGSLYGDRKAEVTNSREREGNPMGHERSQRMSQRKSQNGGQVSLFAFLDENNDGMIDQEELEVAVERGLLDKSVLVNGSRGSQKAFQVRRDWEVSQRDPHQLDHQTDDTMHYTSVDEDEVVITPPTCYFMLSPSSVRRIFWDLFGMFLIGYDTLAIPIELAFEPPANDFTETMFWIALIFWSADIVLTFFTGIYTGTSEEMRMSRIAMAYIRTWFLFDFTIVMADWIGEAVGRAETKGVAMARIVRTMRVLRTLRLLRLAKLRKITEIISDNIASEYTHICINMFKLVLLVLVLNHVVACTWYLIGAKSGSSEVPSWPEANHFDTQNSVLYKYLTSLHWSLTQFTPASMEVFPRNEWERGFAVSVLMFALLVFSSFVSSITASMTQLRQMTTIYDKNMSILRRFLRSRDVPLDLYIRILRQVQHQLVLRKQEIQESDVITLKLLSKPMYEELVHSFYAPTLSHYPFLKSYSEVSSAAARAVANQAVSKHSLSSGDLLFSAGACDDRMIFVKNGKLRYHLTKTKFTRGDQHPVQHVTVHKWCCEASLWTKWTHVGSMFASSYSIILAVDAKKFLDITRTDNRVASASGRYARRFVDNLNEQFEAGNLSDVPNDDSCDSETLAAKAFMQELQQLRRAPSRTENIADAARGKLAVVARNIGMGSMLNINAGSS